MSSMLKKPWLFNHLENPSKEPRGLVQVLQVAEDCSYMIISDKFHFLKAVIENQLVLQTFYSKFPELNPMNRIRGGIVSLTDFVVNKHEFVIKSFEYMGAKGTTPIGSPVFVQEEFEKRIAEINIQDCIVSSDQEELLAKIAGFTMDEDDIIILETPKKKATPKESSVLNSPLFGDVFEGNQSLEIIPLYKGEDYQSQDFVFTQQMTPIARSQKSSQSSVSSSSQKSTHMDPPDPVKSSIFEQTQDLDQSLESIEILKTEKYDPFHDFVNIKKNISGDQLHPVYIEIPNVSTYKRVRKSDPDMFLKFAKKK